MVHTDGFHNHAISPPTPVEVLGHVHAVSGSQASVGLLTAALNGPHRAQITVGKFLIIQAGKDVLVGVITDVSIQHSSDGAAQGYCAVAHVDLMGQIDQRATGEKHFRRGVNNYPTIGDAVVPLTNGELRVIFGGAGATTISLGSLQQDSTVDARVEIDEMLNKHFAVLGSTGVGKSSAVAHLLLQTLQARPNLRIFLLDAHNEYARCFGQRAHVVNPGNLRLPFWLFNFEEIVDVFFGARPGVEEEIEILSEVIPLAKASYTQYRSTSDRPGIKRVDPKIIGYTVDTPVPYRLADLVAMIDERMGKLENRSSRMIYHKLNTRIETVTNDPRYAFMFENANVGGDTMAEAISQLFRLPADGKTMTIMQLAGFPAEVVDAVVSVLSRLAFEFGLWSDGADPLLFVCEEAHKYASADRAAAFTPTRRAISRIAKEGRKYGVYLGLVTQRPAELDPTIISQCGTLFAMRMSNDRDQALLRSAVSDTAANLFAFVPSLGTREALAFGAGIPLPTRMTFSELSRNLIPKSETFVSKSGQHESGLDLNFIASVVERWRGATMSRTTAQSDMTREATLHGSVSDTSLQSTAAAPALDPNRFSLLKKPTTERPDPYAALRRPVSTPSPR
jgi:DNA helicase HerA-like ATPase